MKPQFPGQLVDQVQPDVFMMICTAGHVDHGKTELVRLLTGCQTDRLKEELERGLTIELGFAPCLLGGSLCVGIVDVPGHERFIRNMVAGVSGIGATILVIAADDGVMPQTVEHLRIMELLGVRHGLIALSKIDLVSPQVLSGRIDEVSGLVQGTFLEESPICPISSVTLQGYDLFYETLVNILQHLRRPHEPGVFRMPVERSFSRRGLGSVVQGIPVCGAVRIGDEVEIVPGYRRGRVRGLQCFLRKAEEGRFGQCLALNIPEFSKNPPQRGQVLCEPEYLRASRFLHVRVRTIPGLKWPLKNAQEIKCYTGTSEEMGKIYLLETAELDSDQTALAVLALNERLAVAPHDRLVLRQASPAMLVAGGEILAVDEGERRPRKLQAASLMRAYESMLDGHDPFSEEGRIRRIKFQLHAVHPTGVSPLTLAHDLFLSGHQVETGWLELEKEGNLVRLDSGHVMLSEVFRSFVHASLNRIRGLSQERKTWSLSLGEIQSDGAWPQALWRRILPELEESGAVVVREDRLIVPEAMRDMSGDDGDLSKEILGLYERTGFRSPRPDEIPNLLGVRPEGIDSVVDMLCDQGHLVRLAKNVILSYKRLKEAENLVVQWITEREELDSADFKYVIDSSRKYALAILDHLDQRGVTLRYGNKRRLTGQYVRKLP